ncbi:MAG: hypothetical protein ABH842_03015 [Candidatus Micrarchaeota archaeon]
MTSKVEASEMWLIARHHSEEPIRIEAGLRAIKGLNEEELIQVLSDKGLPFQVRLAAAKQITSDLVNYEDHRKLELVVKITENQMIAQIARNGLRDLALIDGYFLMEDGFGAGGKLEEDQFDSLVRLSRVVLNHPEKAYKNIATRLLLEFCNERKGCETAETAELLIQMAEDERFSLELRNGFGISAMRYYVEEGGKNQMLKLLGENQNVPESVCAEANNIQNHENADMNYLRNIDFMLDNEQLKPEEAGFMYIEFSRRERTTEKGIAESMKRFRHLRPWVREKAMRDFEQETTAMAIINESVVRPDEVSSMTDILIDYVRCCVGRNRNISKFLRALEDGRVPEDLREKAIDIAKRTAIAAAERYGLGIFGRQEAPRTRIRSEGKSILRRIRPVGHA